MNESYDPGTHLLVVALIVFYWHLLRMWRLPPSDNSRDNTADRQASARQALTRLALGQSTADSSNRASVLDPGPGASRGGSLAEICAAHPTFDEKAFLAGAAIAYESVINAYAQEDTAILEMLLDPQACQDFKDAITARKARSEALSLTFVGIKQLYITHATMEADQIEISVRFVSEMIVATHAADCTVIDGDPDRIVAVNEVWTFARCSSARNPNWIIVTTGDGRSEEGQ